jgi:hypothetical protein
MRLEPQALKGRHRKISPFQGLYYRSSLPRWALPIAIDVALSELFVV